MGDLLLGKKIFSPLYDKNKACQYGMQTKP